MSKSAETVGGFKGYIDGVVAELKKCSWPTRPELQGSTMVVIVSVILLAVTVSVYDAVSAGLMKVFLR